MEPLAALMADHRRFDAALAAHQEHLVDRRPGPARDQFAGFARDLRAHAAAEEAEVLPLYGARVEPDRAGEVRYFIAEHDRLRRLLSEIEAWLQARDGLSWPAAEIVRLVEREKTLKEIMEHHDQREDRWLYRGLEEHLTHDECEALLQRFKAAEAAARQAAAPQGGAAALLAAGWLAAVYDDILAGRCRPRMEADWAAARKRLRDLTSAMAAAPRAAPDTGSLEQMAALLDEATPMSRFPTARAAEVHGCWHLLHAAVRAARDRP